MSVSRPEVILRALLVLARVLVFLEKSNHAREKFPS